MAIENRTSGLGNSLLRRVQQHRTMSVIFRALPETIQPSITTPIASTLPVVRATLASPTAVSEQPDPIIPAAALPVFPTTPQTVTPAPAPTIARQVVEQPAIPSAPATRVVSTAPVNTELPMPIQRQSGLPSAPSSPTPPTPVQTPQAAPNQTPQTTGSEPYAKPEWDRLSTILRRHEEKQAAGEQSAAPTMAERVQAPWLKKVARKVENDAPTRPSLKPHERPKPKMPNKPIQRRRQEVQYVGDGETASFDTVDDVPSDAVTSSVATRHVVIEGAATGNIDPSDVNIPTTSAAGENSVVQRQREPSATPGTALEHQSSETAVPAFNAVEQTAPTSEPTAVKQPSVADTPTISNLQRQETTPSDASDSSKTTTPAAEPPIMPIPLQAVEEPAALQHHEVDTTASLPITESLVATETIISHEPSGSPQIFSEQRTEPVQPETVMRTAEQSPTPVRTVASQPTPTLPLVDNTNDFSLQDTAPTPNVNQRENVLQREVGSAPTAASPTTTSSASVNTTPTIASSHSEIEPDDNDNFYQPRPLEDVWPVQKAPSIVPPKTPELIKPMTITAPSQETIRRSAAEDAHVRAHLETIAAEQSSDSSIELVLPRRPRPTVARKEQAHIMPEVPPKPPVVQRAPDDNVASPIVETEIGTLPGDLWQLLGQEPPRSTLVEPNAPAPSITAETRPPQVYAPATPLEAATTSPAASPPSAAHIQRAEQSPAAVMPDVLPPLINTPTMIQRATAVIPVDPNAPATAVESVSPNGVEQTQEQEAAAPQINIDEVAQQVYQALKRKLNFDRERNRWF